MTYEDFKKIMTYKDFKKIYEDLAAWRAERRLTVESQREGLIGNILEELAEVARAKNDDEKVGEICDIAVFAINAMDKMPSENYFADKIMIALFIMEGIPNEHTLLRWLQVGTNSSLKYMDSGTAFQMLMTCFWVIRTLGYDPVAAMSQTIQKINSRRGAYDETLKKWVKDTSEEAKAQWFTPNYALCRVEKLRKNMTQSEIATRLGTTNALVSNWFRGKHTPSQKYLCELQKLGFSIDIWGDAQKIAAFLETRGAGHLIREFKKERIKNV